MLLKLSIVIVLVALVQNETLSYQVVDLPNPG